MTKAQKRTLRKWRAEEKHSAKEYKKYGFVGIASQESRHARVFDKKLKKRR